MADVNVLVVFYSRLGTTEQLALAAGLGAIQSEANIRLRRLADLADRDTIERSAEWRDNVARMNRDYVTPRPADALWADVIVLGTPANRSPEVEQYVESLSSSNTTTGKIAAPIAPEASDAALRPVYAAAAAAGCVVVPCPASDDNPRDAMCAHGRRLVETARALKSERAT